MKNLIKKIKKLFGANINEYTIVYTNPLTQSQVSQISRSMINKFSSNCRPNSISVSQKVVTLDFQAACISGEQLKKVSDDTVAPSKADIDNISLNGVQIWSK